MDLVVHAAGPFQREQKCAVLEAVISSKVEARNALYSVLPNLVSIQQSGVCYLPQNVNRFFLSLYRHHTLMFVMILTIHGEQKVSMNKQKLPVFQLLLLLAYILE